MKPSKGKRKSKVVRSGLLSGHSELAKKFLERVERERRADPEWQRRELELKSELLGEEAERWKRALVKLRPGLDALRKRVVEESRAAGRRKGIDISRRVREKKKVDRHEANMKTAALKYIELRNADPLRFKRHKLKDLVSPGLSLRTLRHLGLANIQRYADRLRKLLVKN